MTLTAPLAPITAHFHRPAKPVGSLLSRLRRGAERRGGLGRLTAGGRARPAKPPDGPRPCSRRAPSDRLQRPCAIVSGPRGCCGLSQPSPPLRLLPNARRPRRRRQERSRRATTTPRTARCAWVDRSPVRSRVPAAEVPTPDQQEQAGRDLREADRSPKPPLDRLHDGGDKQHAKHRQRDQRGTQQSEPG